MNTYYVSKQVLETVDHLFLHFSVVKDLWDLVLRFIGILLGACFQCENRVIHVARILWEEA